MRAGNARELVGQQTVEQPMLDNALSVSYAAKTIPSEVGDLLSDEGYSRPAISLTGEGRLHQLS